MVILTSFREIEYIAGKLKVSRGDIYSVVGFQPRYYRFKELSFLIAGGSKEKVREVYRERWKEIKEWLSSLSEDSKVVLVCSCPDTREGKGQIKERGYFCCHTGLIGKMINKHRPDITVVLDEDRDKKLCSDWKPEIYKTIDEAIQMEREKIRLKQKSLF